jgi:hypothetical protein
MLAGPPVGAGPPADGYMQKGAMRDFMKCYNRG